MRHVIRVMRRTDMTKKKHNDKDKYKDKDNDKDKYNSGAISESDPRLL